MAYGDKKMMRVFFVTITSIFLAGCYQTQSTLGTSQFKKAVDECASYSSTEQRTSCLNSHRSYATFTNAEKSLMSYMALLDKKVKDGELSKEEARFLANRYIQQAADLSAASEAQQQAAFQSQMNAISASMNNLAVSTAIQNQAIINQQQSFQPPPLPAQTRCWRNGYYVNCQSY